MTPKLHQIVTYQANNDTIRAIVRRVHRDGTVTVEARHVLDRKGRAVGGYIGFRYRVRARDLRLVAATPFRQNVYLLHGDVP